MVSRDVTAKRLAAEEACQYLNDKSELNAEAHPIDERFSVEIRAGGFLDTEEIDHIHGLGFLISGIYSNSKNQERGVVVNFNSVDAVFDEGTDG